MDGIYVRAGESLPPKDPVAVSCPITHAAPTDDQPPKFSNLVKTSVAGTFWHFININHSAQIYWHSYLWRKDPKRDKNGKEAEDMKEENYGLEQRKVFRTRGVEEDGECGHGHCH